MGFKVLIKIKNVVICTGVEVQMTTGSLCQGEEAVLHCWSQGHAHWTGARRQSLCAVCRGGGPLLRCPEVENLRTVHYLTQISALER